MNAENDDPRPNDDPTGEKAIWILKTGEALAPVKARWGDFEDWIAARFGSDRVAVRVAAVYEGDPLPPLDGVAGVIVTGSPAMVTELADWSEASARWLARIVEADAAPVLGLCYGHQLIAHALGGEVGVNPRGREMGTVALTLPQAPRDAQPLFEPGRFAVNMSHLESVLRPPTDATVFATTELEAHAALQFGPRQWGVQFHPEFDREIMQGYVDARREILAAEGLDPDTMIESAQETPESASILARFAALAAMAASS